MWKIFWKFLYECWGRWNLPLPPSNKIPQLFRHVMVKKLIIVVSNHIIFCNNIQKYFNIKRILWNGSLFWVPFQTVKIASTLTTDRKGMQRERDKLNLRSRGSFWKSSDEKRMKKHANKTAWGRGSEMKETVPTSISTEKRSRWGLTLGTSTLTRN